MKTSISALVLLTILVWFVFCTHPGAYAVSGHDENALPVASFDSTIESTGGFGHNYGDFTDVSGLILVGDASQAGDMLRLVPAFSGGHAGGVWHRIRYPVLDGFETTFEFRVTDPGTDLYPPSGADGLALVVQTNSPSPLGALGGDMGYAGIPSSIAVEFDTWPNDDEHCQGATDCFRGDPDGNHVSIQTRGEQPNSALHDHSLAYAPIATSMTSGDTIEAAIRYSSGSLAVYINGSKTPVLSTPIDLRQQIGDGPAWVGITSGNAGSWGNFDLLSWSFTSSSENLQDAFLYDMYHDINNAVSGTTTLIAGKEYSLFVSGTYSVWGPDTWANLCIDGGVPEDSPQVPSPGRQNGKVGHDIRYIFSYPDAYGNCGTLGPVPIVQSEDWLSLDGGSTWITPSPAGSGVDPIHAYKYSITGQGHPIQIRKSDHRTDDNYGILELRIDSGSPCTAAQWNTEYYANANASGTPSDTGCTNNIDFYWGASSPKPLKDKNVTDNYSIRWYRTVDIDTAGWYNFRTFTDDGVRLYVDGERIIGDGEGDWASRAFDERSAMKKLSAGQHDIVMEYFDDTGEAMAHLTWHRSLTCSVDDSECRSTFCDPDSATCSPMYMYQNRYPDVAMDTTCADAKNPDANQTLGRWGCVVTSIAMVLQHYGIDTTPTELNTLLSAKDEYGVAPRGYGGQCNGDLDWDELDKIIAKEWNTNLAHQKYPGNTVRQVLFDQRTPFVMRANNHSVAAMDSVEVNGIKTVSIIDPLHSRRCWMKADTDNPPFSKLVCGSPGVLEHYTTEREWSSNTVVHAYYEEVEPEEREPRLQVAVTGGEASLEDEGGRRTGFDPKTGTSLQEIPGGVYYDSKIVPPGSLPEGPIQRVIYLHERGDGRYHLTVIANTGPLASELQDSPTNYSVSVILHDKELNTYRESVSGEIDAGQEIEYVIDFDQDEDQLIVDPVQDNLYLPLLSR